MNQRKWFLGMITVLLCLCFALSACSSNETAQSPSGSNTESQPESSSDAAPQNGDEGQSETGTPSTGTYPDGSTPVRSGIKLKLTVNGSQEVIIAMYDNTAADALLERLPLEGLEFFDLSDIEKPTRTPKEPLSLGDEEPGYDPITGEMVIYRPWGNFTIFYGNFRHSDDLVPLGIVESGLDVISGQTEDFTGLLEVLAEEE